VIERVSDRSPLALVDPSGEIRLVVGAATEAGGRPGNEDMVHVSELAAAPSDPDRPAAPGLLLALADGMGGHERGEVASRLAIETVVGMVAADPGNDVAHLLRTAFRRANEAIYAGGRAGGDGQMMGTTLTVAVLRGKYATIASIGDSRAYLVRAGALTQVTQDHSLVAEQVSKGSLSATQARESPHRNILTHALGHRPKLDAKVPGIFELTLLPEDRLLLCSDGFYDVVPDRDLLRVVLDHEPEAAARRLVDLAVERGTTDNVSAVVAEALPTRVPVVSLEPTTVAADRARFGGLAAVLAAAAVLLFIALIVLALTVL
jgi:protein phosphatase